MASATVAGDDLGVGYSDTPQVSAKTHSLIADYIALTKPAIISLLLVTAVGGMFLAAQGLPPWHLLLAVLVGGYLAAGGANALNHFWDRDIDQVMPRTRRRPVASHRVTPGRALVFGLALNVLAFAVLALVANVLSAALAIGGTLVYMLVYTMWLKRTSMQNIVIGGAAGSFPPLVGWAAVTGRLDLPAYYLFLIIFFWTPPHFWALSLLIQDDYAAAKIPMMPVVLGRQATVWSIFLYTIALIAISALLFSTGAVGTYYLVAALVLGGFFVYYTVRLLRDDRRVAAANAYKYSLLYLFLLFVVVMIDASLPR
ncbi:MAG TPA: heme o synthase [Dehalococcoidia bacterium]|nr:heme o synthase [Dehalococcoidia bacterium]